MKFYYNGKLIRTSKTRHYKYAIGTEEYGFSTCSETLGNAQKHLQQKINRHIETAKSNLNFAKNPENLEWLKERYGADYDADKRYKEDMERVKLYKIVELEEK